MACGLGLDIVIPNQTNGVISFKNTSTFIKIAKDITLKIFFSSFTGSSTKTDKKKTGMKYRRVEKVWCVNLVINLPRADTPGAVSFPSLEIPQLGFFKKKFFCL
jgi:hypothetical protein